ncbi:AAA family ATPase [bacterium]|nr:AAA family ATPase [bacterium]
MNIILDYEITETIGEEEHTVIYRCRCVRDDEPLLVKVLKTEYPSLTDLAKLRHEYEITKNLNIEGVVKPYGMEKYRNGLMLILEDFGAETLKARIASSNLELVDFLRLGIQLADILAGLQQSNIIHKNINPHSIFINPNTQQVKITDFGIASRLSWENQKIMSPNQLEGTLAYMSPEQTGRMNRAIDYRTDFYALGVTFYEMLTRQLPFQATEPLELVHSHIAKTPVSPHELNPDIPPCVSGIVLKLLSKTAEGRYQSAYGIKADLEKCLASLENEGIIDSFILGELDVSEKLQIPQKLYGRAQEIALLMSAFDRASQEKSELMLVSGYSGIGKSALVNEIHKSIVREKGYFISGKCDQLKRNVPYNGITQAFQELIRQILTEDEVTIKSWKERLLRAFGPNGQVIIDVIPEVELIVGEQPTVQQLGPTEAQNRFNMTFQQFVNVFVVKEHPLVIFLDDLQWADSASLKLIKLLMTDPESRHLLLIGAYRDNEVSATHPLMLMLEEIRIESFPISHIKLNPLSMDHVTQFLADALQCEMELVEPIAELIIEKTNGNPFFMIEFLKATYQNGMLFFNRDQGYWEWDLGRIRDMEATGNVVELMAAKIQKCSKRTQEVLTRAACIGSRFNLNTLSTIRREQPVETADQLWEALQEGLILPIGSDYKYLNIEYQISSKIQYRFLHNRVQQAAYSLISEDDKAKVHLRIGQLLLDNTSEDELENKIFDIINHLNIAMGLLPDQGKRIKLARLNLLAGEKAKSSNAYETALMYFRVGMKLLPENSWEDRPDLAFSLHIGRVECEYSNGNFSVARRFFDTIIENARTNLEKATACNIATTLYINLSQYKEAVEVGLEGLKLLGMNLPAEPSRIAIMVEILKAKKYLVRKKVRELIHLPDMTDPAQKTALNLLMNITPAAYFTNQNLLALAVLKGVNLSLRYGNADVSALAYCLYAMIIGSGMGDFESGDDFGHLALNLIERFDNPTLKGRIHFVFGALVNPWRSSFITSIDYCRKGLRYSLEAGDLVYAGYLISCIVEGMFAGGFPMDDVYSELQKHLGFAKRIRVQHAIDDINVVRMACMELERPMDNQLPTSDNDLSMDEQLQEEQVIVSYYLYRCQHLYLFENYADAIRMADEVLKHLDVIFGTYVLPEFIAYHSLILAAVHPTVTRKVQRKHWKILKKNQAKMRKWVKNCPENFLHRYCLVAAEMARISGDDQKAIELYDQAIESAHQNEFIHHEAITNELAAKFYLIRGKGKIAKTYMMEAHYGYLKWGATAKVQALERTYPQLLSQTPTGTEPQESATTISSSSGLDLATVMKASHAISEEIVLEKLLQQMMRILIENAGAGRGLLILERSGEFIVEAEAAVNRDDIQILKSIPVKGNPEVSEGIINYVVRTKERVILNDALREDDFMDDPYIMAKQPKSLLCAPLIHQGKLSGILYLENNLTTGVFTQDRLEVLNLLSAQAATSIENAFLYENLEQLVDERTQKLSQALENLDERNTQLAESHVQLQTAYDDLKRTQEMLIQSEKMATIGTLAGGIAHEINSPMAAILSNAQRILRFEEDLRKHKQSATLIEGAARKCKAIVGSLLKYARGANAEAETVNVNQVVTETLNLLGHHVSLQNIQVQTQLAEVPQIGHSFNELSQVLTNLIVNAQDAILVADRKQAGEIVITTAEDGDSVSISVTDNGTGMSEKTRRKIFDPFFTTKGVGQGTGLGLSIVAGIVERFNGSIDVVSEVGAGTTFTIRFPQKGKS